MALATMGQPGVSRADPLQTQVGRQFVQLQPAIGWKHSHCVEGVAANDDSLGEPIRRCVFGGGNLPRTIRVRAARIRVADPMAIEQLDASLKAGHFFFSFDLPKNKSLVLQMRRPAKCRVS
jgi:hypothetical protein